MSYRRRTGRMEADVPEKQQLEGIPDISVFTVKSGPIGPLPILLVLLAFAAVCIAPLLWPKGWIAVLLFAGGLGAVLGPFSMLAGRMNRPRVVIDSRRRVIRCETNAFYSWMVEWETGFEIGKQVHAEPE